jgi:hypothetical protein
MGINVAVGGIINLVAIAFLTLFADKFNQMRAYRILICLSLACQVCYYCYIEFVCSTGDRPSLRSSFSARPFRSSASWPA